ncbi:hypothetical protein ACFYX8_13880 [Streptomyces cyaneofuscatus]|uniref:hypothetical protein n=1 Tax=Streptomyces cyaneofuscatus TaxID=66883 RepID=UPI0036C088D5
MRDWIPVCRELSDSAIRLYLILRSLVIEKRGPVRKLTLWELCHLLPRKPVGPGEKPGPSNISRIRTLLRQLTAIGLVTTPEGHRLTTSSRPLAAGRRVHRVPTYGDSPQRHRPYPVLRRLGGQAPLPEEQPERHHGQGSEHRPHQEGVLRPLRRLRGDGVRHDRHQEGDHAPVPTRHTTSAQNPGAGGQQNLALALVSTAG